MKRFFILSVFIVLTGCAAVSGTYTLDETKIPAIQDDVTTKEQITAMFGEPQSQNLTAGQGSVWIYHDVTSGADSEQAMMSRKKLKKLKEKTLTIYFTGDIVTTHYYK